MKDSAWLIMNKRGLTRMVKGKTGPSWRKEHVRPALKEGEYAVLISVEVPESAFKPAPLPSASITIPESAIIAAPAHVDVLEPPHGQE